MNDLLTMTHAQYCRSNHWKRVCLSAFRRDGGRCRICNRTAVQVHHRNYDHKGDFKNELPDVISICKRCHSNFHNSSKISPTKWTLADVENKNKK